MSKIFLNQIDLSPSRDGLGYFCRSPANLRLNYIIFLDSNCQLFVNSRTIMSIMSREQIFPCVYPARNTVFAHWVCHSNRN